MQNHPYVVAVEKTLKQFFEKEIISAPVNSMTPFVVIRPDDRESYIFVAKCERWIYEPLLEKSIADRVKTRVKTYTEGTSLIFGFDIEPDISLESEIPKDKIEGFLKRLKEEEYLTIVVMDHITLRIIWMTNDIPFWKVKHKFNPLFEAFGV